MDKPQKPSDRLIKMCEIHSFNQVTHKTVMTSEDTADHFLVLRDRDIWGGGKEPQEITIPLYCKESQHLSWKPDHCSVCQVRKDAMEWVSEWLKWVKQNKKDISELKRLKKKLGEV